VLFVAEAVTLAHVARPAVLIASLDRDRYEPYLACDTRYDRLLQVACPRRPIRSIPSVQFLDALAKGSRLYDVETLRDYVQEDMTVLDEIRPDVVVGDFRLSLSVSARLKEVPYLTISNAYWSPYRRQKYPLPEVEPMRWLGLTLGNLVFQAVRPFAFAYHTRPMNRLRRESGLASLGLDLRRIYTDADYTLYADLPALRCPSTAHPTTMSSWDPSCGHPAVRCPLGGTTFRTTVRSCT
jgi:UDP:flavonoid glycosyltransferase YjiC (YdhE family)